jgi:2-hydroxyacyl-CoA lyase 1
MAEIDGAAIVARALKEQGVEFVYGVVGIPVTTIAGACQREGITYVGMRHEQAAAYAAQATGFLTGKPSVALCVSGPGMLNAVAAFANAWSNCWPMLLIGGASDMSQRGQGAFQEAAQLETIRPFAKYAQIVDSQARLPYYIEQACRSALHGRPGPSYLELPAEIIIDTTDDEKVTWYPKAPPAPRPQADPQAVKRAVAALKTAQRPLVIVGKGAAYSRAEQEVQQFIDSTLLPFLPTPMGKGVVPDDHPMTVAAARTHALQNTDLALLIGARLNWILHFGLPPRWSPDVRIIQVDIAPEEIGTNVPAEVGLVGDIKAVMGQINAELEREPWQFGTENDWRYALNDKIEDNRRNTEPMLAAAETPMGYYRPLKEIRDALPRDAILVSEGASTMDIGRQVLNNYLPRTRLDAGSFGTMGVGPGFAIAAAMCSPGKVVVDVEGDSGFGFDGMEVEVACRLGLPIVYVVFNNNGIGGGPTTLDRAKPLPPNALTPLAHYEKVIEAFGGDGYYIEDPEALRPTLEQAIAARRPALINLVIDPQARRRPQQFAWLTR